jgi:cyanate lyase
MEITATSKTLLEAKRTKGLTFAELGKSIGRDEVWVAALFYGQAPCR